MKDQIVSARRSVSVSSYRATDLPWTEDLRAGLYELTSGRRLGGGYFAKSSYAYACMMLRGTELASLPWRITRNGEVVEGHPLEAMLTSFGPESNYAEGVISTEIDLLLAGAGYWLRDYDILKRLNPTTIEVLTTSAGISGFKQTIDGKHVNTFPREEVVYFREYHPEDDLGPGIPVMKVIKQAVDVERQCLLYIDSFFKNDATPSLLLSTIQTMTKAAMDALIAWWNKSFGGVRKSHKVGIAGDGVTAQILSGSLKDNRVIEIRDQARGEICVGMRVPKILIGDMEKATYANAQEARKFLIEDLIIPRSRHYADAINQDLVQQVDPSVVFEFAVEELQILQEDANLKWERLSGAVEQRVITPEFAAEQMGWPITAMPMERAEGQSVLRSWKRKSMKALKRNEPPDVPFTTDEVPMSRQVQIHARLAQATDVQSVTRAFFDD